MPTSYEVHASALKPGDEMFIYSARKREPRTVKVRRILRFGGNVVLDTTGGRHVIADTATVRTPNPLTGA